MVAGAAGGFAGGYVGSGGDFKAAIIGGLTGAAAGFIGQNINGLVEKSIAHGVVGGAAAEARGGKFGQGFASSFLTKAISRDIAWITRKDEIAGGITAAVLGGSISQFTGGKFANGATTTGFQYLYNQVSSEFLDRHDRVQGSFNRDFEVVDQSNFGPGGELTVQGVNTVSGIITDSATFVTFVCQACSPVSVPLAAGATIVEFTTDAILLNRQGVLSTIGGKSTILLLDQGLKRTPIPGMFREQIKAGVETTFTIKDYSEKIGQ